ncbi:MAG: hypothetical protein ABR615_10905 [Pseudonocardiaceae bacterium]
MRDVGEVAQAQAGRWARWCTGTAVTAPAPCREDESPDSDEDGQNTEDRGFSTAMNSGAVANRHDERVLGVLGRRLSSQLATALGRHDHTPGGWRVGQGQADIQIMLRVRP